MVDNIFLIDHIMQDVYNKKVIIIMINIFGTLLF